MRNPLGLARRVVPRWRDPVTTTRLGELASRVDAASTPPSPWPSLEAAASRWHLASKAEQRDVPLEFIAAEFVGEAIAAGAPDRASEAAHFLLDDPPLPALVPLLQRVYVVAQSEHQQALAVAPDASRAALMRDLRECRTRLRINPRDPVGWSELARLHTILGVPGKAQREMLAALNLSSGNRYITRSGARFFVHLGELERAHDLVRSAATGQSDPWLLASEIALASVAGRSSTLMKAARRVLRDELPDQALATSELASAVATEDLANGGGRRTRQLFRRALVNPHENALAQVQWAREAGLALEVPRSLGGVEHSFEARARAAYAAADWRLCVEEARKWLDDQPFSSQPAILGSYLCVTVLNEDAQALEFCERALFANPDDATLLNNMAVAQIGLGRLPDAAATLARSSVVRGTPEWVARTASGGLLAYRQGNHELGRELYMAAIDAAERLDDPRLAASASAFAAREEIRAQGSMGDSLLEAARAHARGVGDPAISVLLDRVARLASEARPTVDP